MGRYLIRRLIGLPPLLLGITIITFLIVHIAPGSPLDKLKLNPNIKEADLQNIQHTMGLDKPLHKQYISWLSQLLRGDLGISLQTYRPVRDHIVERLPNTLLLTGCALVFALAFAVPMGILAAVRRNSVFDHIVTLVATLGQSIPAFWLGLMLIILFAVQFKVWGLPAFPSGGIRTVPDGGDLTDRIKHAILPIFTLSFAQMAGWMRFVRSQMTETIYQDFVRTARAKGLNERAVIMRHAFRNAALPLITLIGLTLPDLFGGAAVVEALFAWPGIGSLAVDAATNRDYTMVMGLVVFVSVLTVLANLLADIWYAVADPRVLL